MLENINLLPTQTSDKNKLKVRTHKPYPRNSCGEWQTVDIVEITIEITILIVNPVPPLT